MFKVWMKLYLWCFVSNLMETSKTQRHSEVLDITPLYRRLLKRMTEIERELNLHLNYNFSTSAAKDNFLRSRPSKVAGKVLRDETVQTNKSTPKKGDNRVNYVNSDEDIPEDNSKRREQTVLMPRQTTTTRSRGNLPILYLKSSGMSPPSFYTDLSKHQENRWTPPPFKIFQQPPPCMADPRGRCGCCKGRQTGSRIPPQPPRQPLSQLDRDFVQQEIDNLLDRGCKVFHSHNTLFYNCENK